MRQNKSLIEEYIRLLSDVLSNQNIEINGALHHTMLEIIKHLIRLRNSIEGGKRRHDDITQAHKYSSNNRFLLLTDEVCGCFYCATIFRPEEISEWIDESGCTAICPHCGIDSVIGESSGYPITKEFLVKMRLYWFG